MKAVCPREGLLSACQLASVAVPSRDVKPILRNIKAVAGKTGWTLMATDLELGLRLELRSVKVEKTGEALLPASRLTSILREATDDELTIEADASSTTVRGQNTEFVMPAEEPAEFPEIASFGEDKYHEVPAGVLREMIRRTVFATAKESARYSMTGVLWEFADNHAKLIATDGRRLAVATASCTGKGAADTKGQTHVVPAKAMGLLERLLQDGEEAVKVVLRPNEAMFQTDRAMIYTRLVEGRFPNYQEVIPKKAAIKIPVEAGKLLSAVRQAAIMTDEESRRVIFTFSKGKVTLQAEASETGRSKVEMPLEYDGKELKINFDAHFIGDMLRILPADTSLTLELVDPQTPALFRCGPDYLYVVMPLT